MKDMELSDQAIRQRFTSEHDKNFSVIAPAGVGKTTAITRKIASIMRTKAIPLDKLIVVTYTQKAARELQQRTLLEVQKNGDDLSEFRHIFFGTIHAFADQLLRNYGYFIGIASDFEIEQNEKCLWNAFLQSRERNRKSYPYPTPALLSGEKIHALVEKCYASAIHVPEISTQLPKLDVSSLLNYPAKNNANILQFQNNLRLWIQNSTLPFPKIRTKAEAFSLLYENVIAPFEDRCSAVCAQEFRDMASEYEAFRIRQKRLTFSDLIKLSTDLLKVEDSALPLRQYYVILDEAQDTDAQQFQLLLTIAQHPESNNSDFFQSPPAAGRFCMVGDPQQSIYSDRADVALYQNIHRVLTAVGAMEELVFSVTLRFGSSIAKNVNQTFCPILDGVDRQVSFSKITSEINSAPSHPNYFEGWARLDVRGEVDELTFFSHFLSGKSPANFAVKQWSHVAILCPRRAWLFEIQDFFAKQPFAPKTQIHSPTKTYGEYREFAWMRALIATMINPENQFEFSGILREIFAISDVLISKYYRGDEVFEISSLREQFLRWHRECQSLSPHRVIDFLLQTLHIKARLNAIQGEYNGEIEKTLRLGAVQCPSLLKFSENLRRQSSELLQSDNIDENALQLYTFHKAKGLEWPVVFLPFINRKQTPVPHILPEIVDGKIAISNRQYCQWTDPNGATHNGERLLYVALTRQKQQTIFIDDGSEPKMYSIASILQSPGNNGDLIQNLPTFQSLEAKTVSEQNASMPLQNFPMEIKYKSLERQYFSIATPSQSSPIFPGKTRCLDPIAYGNWWHETMQKCSFKSSEVANFLRSMVKNSPDVDLAQGDMEKFILNASFWKLIEMCEQIFSEYPFFIRNHGCVWEGRIDLLLRTENHLHFIDWKTEHIDHLDEFIEKHAHQMQNYKMALKHLFPKFSIDASIYATDLGELIPIC
ncbi:MAG: UvrD-helicase domain-containing protein [Puniceicoccales bacterium]|jgi:ATP-dependent exoDNAse (exonuclease V) beta subunit|nr:UvrD-helicase domain-containing protein [Puniceicoccales bacterium]